MSSKRVSLVIAATAALVLSACGGSGGGSATGGDGPSGDPVSGGIGRIIQASEPRGLDPAIIANSWANSPVVGNALYGQLMIDDPATGEVEYRIATDFTSTDGGSTFTLTLRDDVVFSDGSALTADDVKATWEHAKDPATRSVDFPQASQIGELTVVDDTTLTVELVTPTPKFANSILQTGLNWVTSVEAVAAGQAMMDENPIGAGPYTLERWARQDVIVLQKNDGYYGDEPHLDTLEVRTASDTEQRFNTVQSGGADVSLENAWVNIDKARNAGLQVELLDFGGGSVLTLNTTKAPFDDVRARQALAAALDLDLLDDAVNQGTGEIPETLFGESSPFYRDIPLVTKDAAAAQALFDELAAEGEPVEFTVNVFPGGGAPLGNSIQTQLSAFENVSVQIETIEIAEYGRIMASKDYDVITNSITFGPEPEPRLWAGLHGSSSGNFSGIDDPELNEALDAGRLADDEAERQEAYNAVEERLVEIVPVVFFSRAALAVVANNNVGGLQQYGLGSVLPETIWIQP